MLEGKPYCLVEVREQQLNGLKSVLFAEAQVLPKTEYEVWGTEGCVQSLNMAIQGRTPITVEVGMNAFMMPVPSLLAYLEIGIIRLQKLQKFGANAKLRVFSTGSINTHGDPEGNFQRRQAQLIFFREYLNALHPDLIESINLEDILQELNPNDEISQKIFSSEVSPEIAQILNDMGSKYGNNGNISSQQYGLMHVHPNCFGAKQDKGFRIAVGCEGERVFNNLRYGTIESNENPSMSVIVRNSLSRTAPYIPLQGGQRLFNNDFISTAITMEEMKELINNASLDNPSTWKNKGQDMFRFAYRKRRGNQQLPSHFLELQYIEAVMAGRMHEVCSFIQSI
ncbi:MAG: hypothetical protein WCJ58_03090 [bacterium]